MEGPPALTLPGAAAAAPQRGRCCSRGDGDGDGQQRRCQRSALPGAALGAAALGGERGGGERPGGVQPRHPRLGEVRLPAGNGEENRLTLDPGFCKESGSLSKRELSGFNAPALLPSQGFGGKLCG